MNTKWNTRQVIASTSLTLAVTLIANDVSSQNFDTPMTRMRPIGAASAVDQYRSPSYESTAVASIRPAAQFQETGYSSPVRQAAMQMSFPPSAGASNAVLPPSTSLPQQTTQPISLPPNSLPPNSLPPNLPPNSLPPNSLPPNSLPQSMLPTGNLPSNTFRSSNDLTPIAQPQFGSGGYATMSNCNNVSGPSSYSAASGIGCGQVGYQAPIGYAPNLQPPPNLAVAPGTIPPPGMLAPAIAIPPRSAAPVGPLLTFGQSANPVQVGPGLFGQPKAYVPGQGVRNWLRYLTP